MQTVKLGKNGRIAIPKSILEANGWVAGTEFSAQVIGGKVYLMPLAPVKSAAKTPLNKLIGCIKYTGPPISIEEMNFPSAVKDC